MRRMIGLMLVSLFLPGWIPAWAAPETTGGDSLQSATSNPAVPDPHSYIISPQAKRVSTGKWSPWGVGGTVYYYDYFVDGEKVGSREYLRPDGFFKEMTLKKQKTFWKGTLHGLVIDEFPRTEGYFRLGKRDGITRVWGADGRLEEVAEYKDGERSGLTELPIQGVVSTYRNGVKEGPETYRTHGYMGYSFPVTVQSIYVHGKKQGVNRIWRGHTSNTNATQSDLLDEITYENDKIINSKNYVRGVLRYETVYHAGIELVTKEYDSDGNIVRLTTFDGGKKHGIDIRWNGAGRPLGATYYIQNRAVDEAEYREASIGSSAFPTMGTSLVRKLFMKAFHVIDEPTRHYSVVISRRSGAWTYTDKNLGLADAPVLMGTSSFIDELVQTLPKYTPKSYFPLYILSNESPQFLNEARHTKRTAFSGISLSDSGTMSSATLEYRRQENDIAWYYLQAQDKYIPFAATLFLHFGSMPSNIIILATVQQ